MADDDQPDRLPEGIEKRLESLRTDVFRDARLTPTEVKEVAEQLLADLEDDAVGRDEL